MMSKISASKMSPITTENRSQASNYLRKQSIHTESVLKSVKGNENDSKKKVKYVPWKPDYKMNSARSK